MSIHIGAKPGDIAPVVLMPGDPLRAKFVAENYLENAVCYSEVRGMYGFTGTYRGTRVSVQGSGMGQPSMAIYLNELIRDYGVRRVMRIGSCGALQPSVDLHDIVLAMSASTDSAMNDVRFRGMTFAPCADFALFNRAVRTAEARGVHVVAGNILSSDTFYNDDPEEWKIWAAHGVLAVEMETNQLYTIAAKHGVQALSILTVSDHIASGGELSSHDRQVSFRTMMELALETASGE